MDKAAKRYIERLDAADAEAYEAFLAQQAEAIGLEKRDKEPMLEDFAALLRYFHSQGMTMAQAAARIGPDVLGDFYHPADPDTWYALDSAAKVYPLSMTHANMSVFRVSAYLAEAVVPEVLQIALLSTVKRFPLFATTLRKGFFWHYLDATRRRFYVRQERTMPCQPMNISGPRSPGFRVQYFGRRVSLEVFHILTDGTGAMTFLKTLIREYLRLMGQEIPFGQDVLDVTRPADAAELSNDFGMGTQVDKAGGFMGKMAAQLKGRRTALQPSRVVHLLLPSDELLAVARAKGTTVTGLLLTLIALVCADNLKDTRPQARINIQVPVNMRKFYPSRTLRNFSMYYILPMTRGELKTLDAALPIVDARLKEGTKKESLDQMVKQTNDLVRHPLLRFTPLVLKRAVMRVGYRIIGERAVTTTLSNLGVVRGGFGDHVTMFDFMLGPSGTNGVGCALSTYGDCAVLTLTRSSHDTGFEDGMMALLAALGITVDVEEARL